MAHNPHDKKWKQFRRLLLGTVVENLIELDIAVTLPHTRIEFDEESAFNVPRLDNSMRFKGRITAPLTSIPDERALSLLRARLRQSWADLLGAISVIPLGDRLTSTRDEISISIDHAGLELAFDLEAD